MEQAIKKYNQKRGVFKTSVHLYRNTFARLFVRKGGREFSLQDSLDHKTLEMSKKYVKLYSEDYSFEIDDRCPLNDFTNTRLKL